MFIRRSKFDALHLAFLILKGQFDSMVRINTEMQASRDKWRALALKNAPLTKDEVNALIRLCHPDKHGGREIAKTMTQKLLQLRERAP